MIAPAVLCNTSNITGVQGRRKGRTMIKWTSELPRRVLLGYSACKGFPASDLERGRYAHQRPLVIRECLQVSEDSVEFGACCQLRTQHRLPIMFNCPFRTRLSLPSPEGGHD